MELSIRNDETPLQHHKRLVYGKLVDKTLADVDYSELAEAVYGQSYASDVARRMMYGSRRTLELMDSEQIETADTKLIAELDAKLVELRKERQKFFDQRNAYNKLIREQARDEELKEILEDAIMNGNLVELNYSPAEIAGSDNDLIVSLNDIHYGLVVDNAWSKYSPEICAEMMRRYIERIIEIAKRHGSENCYVTCNGDCVSGNIHSTIQIDNKENVVNQVKGVSELIAQFLSELSSHFKNVYFISVAGNHSRLGTKEDSPVDERLDDLIHWYLSARLQNFDNVVICSDNIDPTMYCIDIRGKTYVGVHGDYHDTSAGKLSALRAMIQKPIYCILTGHLHHNNVDIVQGVKTVMAGAFVGMDSYCVQKRIYGKPEQLVCVVDETGIVCYYDIPLS